MASLRHSSHSKHYHPDHDRQPSSAAQSSSAAVGPRGAGGPGPAPEPGTPGTAETEQKGVRQHDHGGQLGQQADNFNLAVLRPDHSELEADMPPQLGATFVPGGYDDYYIPEVVAPAPQRITPLVPQNMQDDLHRLELDPRDSSRRLDLRDREPSLSSIASLSDLSRTAAMSSSATSTPHLGRTPFDAPASFSPFPNVKLDNVPPTDDEKEDILWNRRSQVLHSNNVVIQLAWARDALSWAEIQKDSASREFAVTRSRANRPQTPKSELEIRTDAYNIVMYLAQQEHPEALFMVAKWVEFGKFGFRPDKKEAYAKYSRASELGHVRAEYRMGMLFEQANDMATAKEHYYRGMSLKDPAASYRMGMMSLLGQHGEKKDYQRGLERILAAAEGADEDAPQGAYVYGMLMVRDLGDIIAPEELLPHNPVIARTYIERAAFLGFPKAQLKMGQAYELCQLGCELRPAVSLHYYALAAKQGVPEAALGVSRWFLFGQENQFAKNEQLAYRYAQEAAAANLPTGEFAMGYYNEIGICVPRDINEAKIWYQRAAEHGNQDAIDRLESLNQERVLSKQDHETTTLTRIKSQHGSQRGKRPDRLRKLTQDMPTLAESAVAPGLMDPISMAPPPLSMGGGRGYPSSSPRASPQPSPRTDDNGFQQQQGQQAHNPRLSSLPVRPHSAAPYPDDDRPPVRAGRPQSTAPYPDDDARPYGGRLGAGFRTSQSSTNLIPPEQQGRGRGPAAAAGGGGGDYGRPYDQGQQQQYLPTGPARPQKSPYDEYGQHGRVPVGSPPAGRPDPHDSLPPQQHQRVGTSHGPRPVQQLRDDGYAPRVNSAPPQEQAPRPAPAPPPMTHSATAPSAKASQGPATFEEMGIPQGKSDGDCVVM